MRRASGGRGEEDSGGRVLWGRRIERRGQDALIKTP